jgi:hypothetical protein
MEGTRIHKTLRTCVATRNCMLADIVGIGGKTGLAPDLETGFKLPNVSEEGYQVQRKEETNKNK